MNPQLRVRGAQAAPYRLSRCLRRGKDLVDRITITVDSHHDVGIERPALWRQSDGSPVAPFTQISSDDVRQGKYVLKNPDYTDRVLDYLDALESAGRYS